MTSSSVRVHTFAKRYKLKSDDLITMLAKEGYLVSNHMSGMTDDMVEAVEKRLKIPIADRLIKPEDKAAKAKKEKEAKEAAEKAKAEKAAAAKAKREAATKVRKEAAAKAKAVKAKAKAKAKAAKTKAKATPKAKAQAKAEPKAEAKPAAHAEPKPEERVVAGPKPKVKPAPKPDAKPAPSKPEAKPAAQQKQEPRRGSRPGPPGSYKPPPVQQQPAKKSGRPKPPGGEARQRDVRESVRRTLAKMETSKRTTKRRKGKPKEEVLQDEAPIQVTRGVTVRELAESLNVESEAVLAKCEEIGITASENDELDQETIELISEDLGLAVKLVADEVDALIEAGKAADPARMTPRSPIVTVMGHVDHGKTSILDYIREARVAAGEAGGITQHVGAYEVATKDGTITFIDTPGHEAFTAMRARGAQVTDLVILVVAADDGVMPQTIEAINHSKAAGVPMIVAVNKCDLPGAQPAQIKQQLTEHGIVVEDFGGEVVAADVSAKTGDGIDKLLELVLLQAELLELKADREASAQAVAVEVRKEEGRGILCTVLVTQGKLKVGDVFVMGSQYGKVRALLNDRGKNVKVADPVQPVVVLGSNGLPEPGDRLAVVANEREAREASMRRQDTLKDRERKSSKKLTLEQLYSQIQEGEVKELNLVIKADTNGSAEALSESLGKLNYDESSVKVLHTGVGVVGESDVLLAASSEALIIAFGVKVSPKAKTAAQREKVDVRNYNIIYEVIEEVDKAMKGLLEPERIERVLGRAEVRKVFKVSKLGLIAGSFVTEGAITRNASARVLREEEVVFDGKISSLKRFQEDVREVQSNFECGIGVTGFNDLQEGDIVEAYVVEEKARV